MISKLIFCLRACIFVHAVAVMMEKECNELFLLLLICRLEEEKKKLKEKERQKGLHGGQKASRAHLANIRVVQPNLVYTVGLAMDICHEGILKEYEFFGQFGKMVKISVNRSNQYMSTSSAKHGATGSAYVTYKKSEDALKCIKSIDGVFWKGRPVKACFGTTKYCNAFLRGMPCTNPECLYLHELADEDDCLTKEEVAAGLLPSRFMAMGATNTFKPRLAINHGNSWGSLDTMAACAGVHAEAKGFKTYRAFDEESYSSDGFGYELPEESIAAPPPPPPPPPRPPPPPPPPKGQWAVAATPGTQKVLDSVEIPPPTSDVHQWPTLASENDLPSPRMPQQEAQGSSGPGVPSSMAKQIARAASAEKSHRRLGPQHQDDAPASKLVPLNTSGKLKAISNSKATSGHSKYEDSAWIKTTTVAESSNGIEDIQNKFHSTSLSSDFMPGIPQIEQSKILPPPPPPMDAGENGQVREPSLIFYLIQIVQYIPGRMSITIYIENSNSVILIQMQAVGFGYRERSDSFSSEEPIHANTSEHSQSNRSDLSGIQLHQAGLRKQSRFAFAQDERNHVADTWEALDYSQDAPSLGLGIIDPPQQQQASGAFFQSYMSDIHISNSIIQDQEADPASRARHVADNGQMTVPPGFAGTRSHVNQPSPVPVPSGIQNNGNGLPPGLALLRQLQGNPSLPPSQEDHQERVLPPQVQPYGHRPTPPPGFGM